jgi:hypothetical protein
LRKYGVDEVKDRRKTALPDLLAPPTAEADGTKYKTVGGFFAAISEITLDEADTYVGEKDFDALKQMVSDGDIILLKKGITMRDNLSPERRTAT